MSERSSQTGPASAGSVFDLVALMTKALTGAVLAALVALVCAEVFLRSIFGLSLGFAEEVTGYFVVMLTCFGAALALRSGALFQVNFLFDALPVSTRTWLQRLFVVGALIVCALLAWKTTGLTLSSLERGKFAPTVLRTPIWIPQLMMPLGFAVIGFFLIERLLSSGRNVKAGD